MMHKNWQKILEFGKVQKEDENPPFLPKPRRNVGFFYFPEYFIIIDFFPVGWNGGKGS